MTSYRKKLQPASPKNLGMHPQGPPFSLNVAATVSQAVGMVDAEDAVDAEDMVDTVDTEEAVEPETATKVSAPRAKLTAILQMHAQSGNALRREETQMSAFVSNAGSHDVSKSIASPPNV
jgi:hypothetical protein